MVVKEREDFRGKVVPLEEWKIKLLIICLTKRIRVPKSTQGNRCFHFLDAVWADAEGSPKNDG